ncbi:hypothetical protein NHH03_09110 [Stieleria sp. TO1_6]|uniref:hypothetical protein n=1 Tax=Stieleria tagensis TaxID=2956795 RepID=UPI00209B3B92|nr:hypothetical protein [Stieleria tagensis]MCO8121893.1 hypothetical protein [Stieleria tagensis]
MSPTDAIHRRGQALEDAYFQRVDQELLQKLRDADARSEKLQELAQATGLRDDQVANHLLDAGINVTNIAALTLTPLVFVAWASGSVTEQERQTVISEALRRGVNSNPLAFQLLQQWLQTRPSPDLWTAWKEYAGSLHQSMPTGTDDKFAQGLLEQAIAVAEASGGVLGVGKTSPAEQRVIDELRDVLGQPASGDA